MQNFLRKVSALFQSSSGSYKRHNGEYEEVGKFEKERNTGMANIDNDLINDSEMRVKDLLDKHPDIQIAIDVGSGTGWSAAALSPLVNTVIGIEPSSAAVEISKEIYSEEKYPNITWINGFAENILPTLEIETPSLFLTGCVLSHIRDKEVITICKEITKLAPIGSTLSFAECWGDESWHQLMWHVRTKEWWQTQLPGWELDFHGPQVPGEKYHKGIWGVKIE